MASDDQEWTWKFAPRAAEQFANLEHHVQDRIASKLDEIVDDPWRDPDDYLEPLTGGPFEKLRVGQYRLACVLDRDAVVIEVHRIEHRSGAYTADDRIGRPDVTGRTRLSDRLIRQLRPVSRVPTLHPRGGQRQDLLPPSSNSTPSTCSTRWWTCWRASKPSRRR